MRSWLIALFLALLFTASAHALMPPWYYFHAKVRACLETDAVRVLELEQGDGTWVVPIQTRGPGGEDVARALATVLRREHQGMRVRVRVLMPDGSPAQPLPLKGADPAAEAKAILETAFRGNPHVSGVFPWDYALLIEAKPYFIQFWADNISDRHGLAHVPPADLLQELLDLAAFKGVRFAFSYDRLAPR